MSQPQINIFETPELLARAFAKDLANQIQEADNEFHVALSGGSTPKLLFSILAADYSTIDWSKVHFYWGDERCVPPTDGDSNYKMTKELLLDGIDLNEDQIHRVLGENDPKAEAVRYGDLISKKLPFSNGLPVFDMIMLGMGDDGHTASIFPHEIELLHSANICEVATHPDSGQQRVTLTGDVINNARSVVFLVTGANKREKVEAIFVKDKSAENYPAAHIQPKGTLIWNLDKAAYPYV